MKSTAVLIQFFKFNIMGLVHVATFSIMLFIGYNIFYLNHFGSAALGYIAVLIVGAIGNIFYVFRSLTKAGHFWRYFILNLLVYSSSVSVELSVTYLLVPFLEEKHILDIYIVVVQYLIYGTGGIYVFCMNRFVIFKHHKPNRLQKN